MAMKHGMYEVPTPIERGQCARFYAMLAFDSMEMYNAGIAPAASAENVEYWMNRAEEIAKATSFLVHGSCCVV